MEGVRAEGDTYDLMEATIKVILETTLQTDMANILIKQGISMKDNGRIICPMEEEKLSIPMKVGTMDNF